MLLLGYAQIILIKSINPLREQQEFRLAFRPPLWIRILRRLYL